jgi:predicted ATPase
LIETVSPPFYVITGGPGSGKTTLLAELARHGLLCIPEDARAVIQEQIASGGSAVPWADAPRFAELLMQRSILTWEEQVAEKSHVPIYFDRGVLAPWWPEIYSTDTERRQSAEEAKRTEHAIVKTYTELGYRIVRLPLASPAERADFVLRHSAPSWRQT